jgi:hypothetical protein
MGNVSMQAKERWNSAHYQQLKISIDPELASAFKEACSLSGVSMTSKLSQYMSEYSGIAIKHKRSPEYTTKRQRRAAVKSIVQQLKSIMAAEKQCLENIPENFRESSNFESADESVSLLEEVIELLISIY